MPIYEYQCQKCGHTLEALQKLSDKPLRECPECGKHQLKRLVSAPMFRLAGSGWYETDFKSDKETKRNLLEKGDKEAAPAAAPEPATAKPEPAKPAKEERAEVSKSRTMAAKPARATGAATGSGPRRKPKVATAKSAAKRAPRR
jgi:putative FmdB family regulatory protein